ncbi:GLPGLI family protein [Chryseobacterium shigense]|uniref:GLPGLI family protein n=1 Tax=Chryseobacterium shigense TaxID=297244 RepID=A0A1N7IQ51_9FLAO|nr:GLPGLI family protein [Chryseobacterium shigense]PQA95646.1 GLPGLI family protein [Chryseobacterium shigense]SIS39136.1 GLPGLI family protein [Chryseobacterium shigense]
MKIYSLIFCLLFALFNAQGRISLTGNSTIKAFPYSSHVLSNSNKNIYYQLSYVRDTKNPKNKRETICTLQLSEKFSRFSDHNGMKTDSLEEKYSHQNEINAKEFSNLQSFPVKWFNVLVKDISQQKVYVQDVAKDIYQYEEKQPEFLWTLEKENKKILGYVCQKATTQYRGRKYTAWHAKEIPINSGPYIFQGLPGLIMEIEDSKGDYHFTAIAIDKKSKEIYLRNEKHIINVSREQFRKVQKNFHENPGFFFGGSYDANGNSIVDKGRPIPYNPIELE